MHHCLCCYIVSLHICPSLGQEERERRSKEGGSVLGPLAVSPIVTPSEEAILFRVEAVQDSQTLVDGDVAGIGREFRLLAEDIMEEVEVVADEEQKQWSSQELEEKTVEEQGQDRPGGPSEHQALDVLKALAALQVELSSECEQNHRAYHQRRKHHLAWGSAIIQGIPGFWAKTIMSHPQVSVMISDQDQDFLDYMIDLKVQVWSHLQSRCKLIFSFQDNPYFLNTMIIKEYYLDITGNRACHSTPVHWFWDFEWGSPSHSLDTRSLNFLNWLSGHNGPELNRIADLISNDMWDDPLKYYLGEDDSSIRDN
ncbi:testis-specific Y-encoded protein 1-like [Bos mutus]|uniref:testis-specific Y-encoded protein 1-like n=1 Tax=Bos mutus TaxID=72004 RepID=UPI0038B6002B